VGPGDVVAERFELETIAGSGGMGTVFRARDRLTGDPVGLKVLRFSGELDVRRFAREARMLAEARHPGIVRYVAHGTTPNGEPWLAMEWLEGETLAQRLKREPLGARASVELVQRLAAALGAVHARGFVHRDVKPQNVFLQGGDVARPKLLDFGLARLGGDRTDLSVVGVAVGTPSYMAPEQARGARDVDARADVFALGALLFRCIAGEPPFLAPDASAILARLLTEEAPRLDPKRHDLPPALVELVARMLAKTPSERPADAAEVAAALDAILPSMDEDTPRSAPPPALGGVERRLLCVLMAGKRLEAEDDLSTLAVESSSPSRGGGDPVVSTIAHAHGGRVERQLPDAAAITLTTSGNVADLARQGARCALALRAVWPHAPIAVALGWAEAKGGWASSAVAERARVLVGELEAAGARRVRVDGMAKELLDERFELAAPEPASRLPCRDLVRELEAAPVRRLLGRAVPCVGRDREIAMLEGLYAECTEEPAARAVLVTAPAGTGKSRVRHELLRRLRAHDDGAEVLLARGDPASAGAPFGLVVPELRRLAGVSATDDPQTGREKLLARFGRHLPVAERRRGVRFLGELVGIPFPEDEELRAARRDPTILGDQVRRAFEEWLAAECKAHPVLLVIEDLHWGDLPSVRLVDGALRSLRDAPLFVLALARPEVHERFPNLWSERGLQELRLGPLGKRAAERLVKETLGDRADAETCARVVELAAGNALYLEELVRAVDEGRKELPPSLVAMVQARIEQLDPEARRVLRAASVFGQVFWRGGLLGLLGGPQRALHLDEWLDELCERELASVRAESRVAGDREYVFRHALVQEAAYAMLTEEDRALGHRLCGEWLEKSGEGNPLVLAEHFDKGGLPARASGAYRDAARQALEGNDFASAIAHATRALAGAPNADARAQANLLLLEAHKFRAEHAEVLACAERAIADLPPSSPSRWMVRGEQASALARLGRYEEVVEPAVELLEVAPGRHAGTLVLALALVGVPLVFTGRRDLVRRVLARLDALEAAGLPSEPLVEAALARVRSYAAQHGGDAEGYLRGTERALAAYERAGALRQAALIRCTLGYARIVIGLWSEARAVLEEALERSTRLGLATGVALARHNLGLALARLGDLDGALREERQAVEDAVAQRDRRIETGARGYLAVILLERGDAEGALAEARRAFAIGSEQSRVQALALEADALLTLGRAAEALEVAERALATLAAVEGAEEGAWLAHAVHIEALGAVGRTEDARAAATVARQRLLEAAARIGEPQWREAFLRVPERARILAAAERPSA
jgi:tetratricopeptide (TPR) repeat protein